MANHFKKSICVGILFVKMFHIGNKSDKDIARRLFLPLSDKFANIANQYYIMSPKIYIYFRISSLLLRKNKGLSRFTASNTPFLKAVDLLLVYNLPVFEFNDSITVTGKIIVMRYGYNGLTLLS